AWGHLRPPVTDTLEIGSGLDLGYIRGFDAPEADNGGQGYRWSSDNATIRNVSSGDTGSNYDVVWSGWRPTGAPPSEVAITWEFPADLPPLKNTVVLPNSADWGDASVPAPNIVQDAKSLTGMTKLDVR